MKNTACLLLKIIGLIFLYGAIGVLLYWIFRIHLPLYSFMNTWYFASGEFIVLPSIGYLLVNKFSANPSSKFFGLTYIAAWGIVVLRTLVILFSK